jgi:hypothetical protein
MMACLHDRTLLAVRNTMEYAAESPWPLGASLGGESSSQQTSYDTDACPWMHDRRLETGYYLMETTSLLSL